MNPIFEAVHSDADTSVRCLRFSCPHFSDDHTWHYHPEFELTYVVSSEGVRFVGDSVQHYRAGDLVLIGPNLPHCWTDQTHLGSTPTPPELMVIQFNRTSLSEGFLSLVAASPIRRLLAHAEKGLQFQGSSARRAGELMRAALDSKGLQRLLELLGILNLLAEAKSTRLTSSGYASKSHIDPISQDRVDTIHRYIHERLGGTIRQAEIAALLGLSAPAFSRFFKTATGKTLMGLIKTLRVNEACRQLHDRSLSITDIAMSCGYNNISNFNRQFLDLKQMNPSQYRRCVHRRSVHHSNYIDAHSPSVTGAGLQRA